ncbi:putative membrane protein [Povalibacter uvarum]|uniref:Putative membrane protein n=1 Tax=Povalibacter uvarum TaxID=732238 RepID=A0A841HHS2_9GAMM|nr:hypothetical protein [Povalibacter uvarum]MBB6092114.1 putative membrane protein [Povalibacter uvarum]
MNVYVGIAVVGLTCVSVAHASQPEQIKPRTTQYCAYGLGDSAPGAYATPTAINNRNHIVGYYVSDGRPLPFVWSAETGMRKLPLLEGDDMGSAADINDRGEIVGVSMNQAEFMEHSVRWHRNGEIEALSIPFVEGASHYATGINRRGDITGSSNRRPANPIDRGYLLERNGNAIDLGTLDSPYPASTALGLNDAGTVVGFSTFGFQSNAFVWTRATGLELLWEPGRDGWYAIAAYAVNNRGHVVGSMESNAGFDSFFWSRQGGLVFFNVPDGSAKDINARDQVVGWGSDYGYLWDRRNGVQDLNTLVDRSSSEPVGQIITGYSINDAAWIAAQADDGTQTRAVVLIPQRRAKKPCPPTVPRASAPVEQ